jgi:CHAT domain-containing protein
MMGPLFKNADARRQFPPIDACLFLMILLAIVTGSACAQSSPNQGCVPSPEASQLLMSGAAPVTRTLKAKEGHVYHVALSPEQYMHVVVNQSGIDVIVKLFDPNSSLLIQRDSPNSQFGPEKVSTVAQVSGNYYVVVCGAENEPGGTYQIKLDGPRDKTTADGRRVVAEQAYYQASKLQEQSNSPALEGAISYYQESANIWREVGDVNEEGYAFSNIGDLYRSLRQFKESETHLETALIRLRDAGDASGQAYVLNSLGATYRDLSQEPRKGIARYHEAITLRRSIGDRWGEAQLLNNLGRIHEILGEREESLRNLESAHTIWKALGARNQEMNTLNNIATTNLHVGNMTEAAQQFEEVLNFCKEAGSPCPRLEPYVRNSLGVIYDTWAQPNKAIAEYNLALTLFPQLREDTRSYQATALDNLGLLFIGLEDRDAALEKFEEALKLRVELKSPGEESYTRSNLGFLHILRTNLPEAFTQLEKALPLSRGTNARTEGNTLMRMGFAHFKRNDFKLNDKAKALERYGQALEVQTRIGDVRGQAITLHYIAELYSSIEQAGNARRDYRRAQERWKEVGDLLGESISLYGLAKLEQQQKRLPDAREAIVESIDKVESMRTRMSNYRLRQTFFDARHDYYEREADVRMQLFHALQKKKSTLAETEMKHALFAAERARSRNLLDLLYESQTDIREGVDPMLLEKELTQRRQISEKLDQLQKLAHQPSNQTEKTRVQQELDALNRSFDQTRAQIRDDRSKRYAALTQPQPLKPAQIQELLDDETCLLQYMVGDERSYLWFVTRNKIRPYTLPRRAEIREAVEALIEVIRVHESSDDKAKRLALLIEAPVLYPKRVFELSNMVLKSVTSRMGFKRIIVVADGPLQYVPFGALTVPNEANAKAAAAGRDLTLLMANHEVIYEPSASVLALIRRDPRRTASKTVAVIADPVFDKRDERVQAKSKLADSANAVSKEDTQYLQVFRDAGDIGSVGGSSRLVRLRYSRQEAEAIVGVAGGDASMVALDFDASRTKALSEDLRDFKYIHLATHGILDSTDPELSGLVFSLVNKRGEPAPGFLRLSDIYNLKLPAELVVLSACQSALGKEVKSEGLTGLTRGFMYAGAARVVASLWKVDDEATAELMKRFYNYMIEKKMPPSKALRQAQLDISTLRERWRPSFYWAGFVLQGEWN